MQIKYIKVGVNEATYRLSAIISYPEKKINETFSFLSEYLNVYNENQELKNIIDKLNSEKLNYIFLENENKRLKEIVGEDPNISEGIVSRVLIDKDRKFLRSIILNKGSKNGIKLGMVVLEKLSCKADNRGKLHNIQSNLISDSDSNIPVVIEPGSANLW